MARWAGFSAAVVVMASVGATIAPGAPVSGDEGKNPANQSGSTSTSSTGSDALNGFDFGNLGTELSLDPAVTRTFGGAAASSTLSDEGLLSGDRAEQAVDPAEEPVVADTAEEAVEAVEDTAVEVAPPGNREQLQIIAAAVFIAAMMIGALWLFLQKMRRRGRKRKSRYRREISRSAAPQAPAEAFGNFQTPGQKQVADALRFSNQDMPAYAASGAVLYDQAFGPPTSNRYTDQYANTQAITQLAQPQPSLPIDSIVPSKP